ncbi:MAG TPA: hypothetical protein VHT71_10645 [Methylomirabilota bacterium]|jgi:hypothetical protein|nr:hypothetical protein [Methylomirabilota bacterium]
MTDTADASPRSVACRSCGNRLAPTTRRCPACGLRDPATPPAPPPASERAPARSGGGVWRVVAAAVIGALAGAAITTLVFIARPPRTVLVPVATPVAAPPAPAAPAPPPVPAAQPEASRSRGRTDWLFFFKSGDRLVRMSDDAPAGLVLRTEKAHAFADGTAGPAYLVQLPDGGQRFIDADELERGTRLE